MKNFVLVLLATVLIGSSLVAGPVVPGSVQNLFNINGVDYTATLGGTLNGSHDPSRTNLSSAFDNSTSTFYSLGIGGTLEGIAGPGLEFDPAVGVIEVTFGTVNSQFPESAIVRFFEGATEQASVKLVNLGGQSGACDSVVGLTCSSSATESTTIWSIVLPAAFAFNRVLITDTTGDDYTALYNAANRASDGFDIAELSIATVISDTAVPEPGTLTMLGMGLGLLALAYRKRTSKVA